MGPELAAIIVHDIKNALTVLEGELRRMVDAPDRDRAASAHATCLGLQDKLVGFLMLYKASTQGLVAHIEAVSPADFLASLMRQLGSGRPEVALSIDAAGMPAVAFFDENLVTLALEAALQNALRFALSRIEIACVQRDGYLAFTVRDDGPGIGAKEKTVSTGLGMDLCNVIAAAHIKGDRGGVALLGNGPGGGALFELRLP